MKTWTFFFTDIEGSTVLFERAGPLYEAAQQQHFAILRAALLRHGGQEFRETGDGLLAVFADSPAAVACARECQQDLRAADWPGTVGALRVRIGLHRGPAERAAQDFRGLTMHHATRVLDATQGTQILCSQAVCEDLPPPSRMSLRDLGFYRLRGVAVPVRLYDIPYHNAPDGTLLVPDAPPAFTHVLPAVATKFFGREAEIASLVGMLLPLERPARGVPGRLVTILGPGGTGKTRLSLAVAAGLLPEYSHAVWFVPLAESRDPSLIVEKIRDTLGLPGESSGSALEQVSGYLGSQPSLLVLDNLEQLLPEGGRALLELLVATPLLACLVTSRVRLDIGCEAAFSLPPLRIPAVQASPDELSQSPSVRLFVDRVQAIRHDFALTPLNAPDVAELCRALEGIPLALELAAARAAVLTPRQMLARLGHRLEFLAGGRMDMPARHRTLRATIGWSFDLLGEAPQRALARLAIFQGGWTLEAAEAVAAEAPNSALDGHAELQRASLLIAEERDGGMRFRMSEMVREFAAERLATTEAHAELAARHHAYYFGLCRDRISGDDAWHRRLSADVENVRAMLAGPGPIGERLRAAVCLYPFWMSRGTLREGREWLGRLRAEAGAGLEETNAAAANAAAILAWKAGDTACAQREFESALRFWQTQGNERNIAGLLNNLGMLASDRGELALAREYYGRSVAIYRREGSGAELGAALSNCAECAMALGDLTGAGAALGESERLLREQDDVLLLANTLHNLTEWKLRAGEIADARHIFAECLSLRERLGSRDCLVATWVTLAALAAAESRPRHAAFCAAAAAAAIAREEEMPNAETRAALEQHLEAARRDLPPREFDELCARSEAMALHETFGANGEWLWHSTPDSRSQTPADPALT